MLDCKWVGIAEPFGHLPAVLAFDIAEKNPKITQRSLTRFDPRKAFADPFANHIEFPTQSRSVAAVSRPDIKIPRQSPWRG
jgi:hypothetical protein